MAVDWAAGVMRRSRSKGFARKVRELIDLHLEAVEPVLRTTRWKGEPMKPAKVARSIAERRGSLAHGARSVGTDRDQFKWEVTRARLLLAGLILDDVLGEPYRERVAAIVNARSYPYALHPSTRCGGGGCEKRGAPEPGRGGDDGRRRL